MMHVVIDIVPGNSYAKPLPFVIINTYRLMTEQIAVEVWEVTYGHHQDE